ncbi:MAG: hypothetical protein H8K03_21300 [Nitrospira sp.]
MECPIQVEVVREFQAPPDQGLALAVSDRVEAWDRVEVWVHLVVREAAANRLVH